VRIVEFFVIRFAQGPKKIMKERKRRESALNKTKKKNKKIRKIANPENLVHINQREMIIFQQEG